MPPFVSRKGRAKAKRVRGVCHAPYVILNEAQRSEESHSRVDGRFSGRNVHPESAVKIAGWRRVRPLVEGVFRFNFRV